MSQKNIVTIDGPSGVGKSTVAKAVAQKLGYCFVDTGALYRSAAFLAINQNIDLENPLEIANETAKHSFSFTHEGYILVDGEIMKDCIRTPKISQGASIVAKHPKVRQALLGIQKELGKKGSIVAEGRDTGTVVFPNAKYKFFLVASAKERARRRYLELTNKDPNCLITLEEVEKEQIERDLRDTQRAISPLLKAIDATEINCESITAIAVADTIVSKIKKNS